MLKKMPMLIDEHIEGLTEMKYAAQRKSIHSMNEKIKKISSALPGRNP